jgi:hypothetical protein
MATATKVVTVKDRLRALAMAKTQVGVRENPPGSNNGTQVRRYLKSVGINFPAAWCLAFVHWCYETLGITLPGGGLVQALETWAASVGELVKRPRKGDLICYDWNADNWYDHVGIVERVLALRWRGNRFAGWVQTIEGNTSSGIAGSQSDGDGVYRRRRWLTSTNARFIRVTKRA